MYEIGAGGRIRTPDLLITNQLLYQLSYTSVCSRMRFSIPAVASFVKHHWHNTAENLKNFPPDIAGDDGRAVVHTNSGPSFFERHDGVWTTDFP